jgi:glutamine synthetase
MGGIGVMDPVEDEVAGIPDIASLKVLPWDRRIAWMVADMSWGGRESLRSVRPSILKKQVKAAAELGYVAQLGVEPEFLRLQAGVAPHGQHAAGPDGAQRRDQASPAYDVETTLDSMPFPRPACRPTWTSSASASTASTPRAEKVSTSSTSGTPRSSSAADRMTLSADGPPAAKECGLLATCHAQPFADLWGSGAHST